MPNQRDGTGQGQRCVVLTELVEPGGKNEPTVGTLVRDHGARSRVGWAAGTKMINLADVVEG